MELPITSEPWEAALFDQSPVSMALVADDHHFARCNDTWCSMLGYARKELESRTWQSITHPDDVEGDAAGAKELLGDPTREVYTITKRYITKRGEVLWVNHHVRAVWEAGKFIAFFVIAIPVSAVEPIVSATKPFSFTEWARKNPKDSLIIGLSATLFLGREAMIELLKTWIK